MILLKPHPECDLSVTFASPKSGIAKSVGYHPFSLRALSRVFAIEYFVVFHAVIYGVMTYWIDTR